MDARINSAESSRGLLNFTQHLVPISDFSRGKTAQVFDDVKNNNTEYVVLKNNQPTAIVISLDTYQALVEKAIKMEKLFDSLEEERLLAEAKKIEQCSSPARFEDFNDVCREFGFDPKEIEAIRESVDIE